MFLIIENQLKCCGDEAAMLTLMCWIAGGGCRMINAGQSRGCRELSSLLVNKAVSLPQHGNISEACIRSVIHYGKGENMGLTNRQSQTEGFIKGSLGGMHHSASHLERSCEYFGGSEEVSELDAVLKVWRYMCTCGEEV